MIADFLVAASEEGRPKTNEEESLSLVKQRDPDVTVKLADLENTAITADFGHEFGAQKGRFRTSHAAIEVPDTLDWTAPELLREGGSAASAGSDVYALTMTMWEVATLGIASPTQVLVDPDSSGADGGYAGGKVLSVKERLCAGARPSWEGTAIPQQLRHTLEQGWGAEVGNRPSAENLRFAIEVYVKQKEGDAFSTDLGPRVTTGGSMQ